MNYENENALVIYEPRTKAQRSKSCYSAIVQEFFDKFFSARRIPFIRHTVLFAALFFFGSCFCAHVPLPTTAILSYIARYRFVPIVSLVICSFSGFTIFGKSVSYLSHSVFSLYFGYLLYHSYYTVFRATPIAFVYVGLFSASLAFLFSIYFVEIEYAYSEYSKMHSKKYAISYFSFNLVFIYLIVRFFTTAVNIFLIG